MEFRAWIGFTSRARAVSVDSVDGATDAGGAQGCKHIARRNENATEQRAVLRTVVGIASR